MRELYAEVELGIEAEAFARSGVGQYLVGRADQEIAEALEELKRVASWRRRRIRDLQNKIWRAESFKGWLAEMIQSGRLAEDALSTME